MSVDRRLRSGLARMAAEVDAAPSPALGLVRARARRRNRMGRGVGVLAVAFATALLVVAAPRAVDLVTKNRQPTVRPSSPLVGTFVVDLAGTPANRRAGVVGRWVVSFRPDGSVDLNPPTTYRLSRTGQSYRVDGDRLRTDVLVDTVGCQAEGAFVGTYRWTLDDTTLRFALVSDACPARIALFTGQDWETS